MTEESKPTDYRTKLVLALRFFQVLTVAMVAVGFIWGMGDLVLSILPADSPITPLSLLMILYGGVGSVIIEAAIRIVQRKK